MTSAKSPAQPNSECDPQAVSDAAEFLRIFGSKFAIIEAHVNSTLAERLTLNRIKELTRPTDRVFYFHSKGARLPEAARRCRL